MPIPSHTRYAAPTAVSTVSSSGERATNAPTPAATTAVAARCPANRPPTAGNTSRCLSPAVIAYAQSAPGVITNKNDTAQNAATVPPVTIFSFNQLWRERIGGKSPKVLPNSRHQGTHGARIIHMDAVDRQILAELQHDGRMTLTELAERVGLSLSPCHRRLRALEHSGAINGYHAHLDPTHSA